MGQTATKFSYGVPTVSQSLIVLHTGKKDLKTALTCLTLHAALDQYCLDFPLISYYIGRHRRSCYYHCFVCIVASSTQGHLYLILFYPSTRDANILAPFYTLLAADHLFIPKPDILQTCSVFCIFPTSLLAYR